MKLLLTANPKHKQDNEEYRVIHTFEEFRALTHDDISAVDTIKLDDFLLSMSCFYWLVDYDLASLGHIDFIVATTDKERAQALRESVAQYMRKYDKFKPPQYIPEVS